MFGFTQKNYKQNIFDFSREKGVFVANLCHF